MDTDKYELPEDAEYNEHADDDMHTADTVMEPKPHSFKKTRKPRGFKIALIVLLALFVLFAGFIYFLPHFLPMDTIRGIAKDKAKEMLGMDVDFQNLGFSWNGSVVLDGITLSPLDPAGAAGEALLTVDEVRTSVAVSPLLQGKIVVNNLDVNGFSVRLRRNADGTLNLPDLSKLTAEAPAAGRQARQRLSAVAAETAAALPPIEVHRVNLRQGILGFDDAMENRSLNVGLDFLTIEGQTLDDPFVLSGRLLPYPGEPDKGDIPFTGRVAMLKNGQLDLNGEAALEAEVRAFSFNELAKQLGFGDLLPSGQANGLVKAAYSEGKAILSIPDFKLQNAAVGLGENHVVQLPDSSLGMDATFDPGPGVINFTDLSLSNELNSIKAKGWVEGVNDLANGVIPAANLDYSGIIDFDKAGKFVAGQNLGLDGLPEVGGSGSYFGKLTLPRQDDPAAPLAPTLTVDFNDGNLEARDAATGIVLDVTLAGIAVKAAASLAEQIELNSTVNFHNVPASATVPQLGATPVTATLNGGAALTAGAATGVELRLRNTTAHVPATPWSGAMDIVNPETSIAYDMDGDTLRINALDFKVNNMLEGKVTSGAFTGILAGNPQGQADMAMSTLLDAFKGLFQPLVPEFVAKLAGSFQAVARVKVDGKTAEAMTRAEMDQADVLLALPELQAALASPKATVSLQAALDLDRPLAVNIASLEVNGSEATLQARDQRGDSAAGRFGVTALKAAGVIDLDRCVSQFSNLSLAGNGMSVLFGRNGKQAAGLDSGVMQVVLATPENNLLLPISGAGDFNLPSLDAGIDNLVFYALSGEERVNSDFGNLRARVGVDGYIGSEKQQIVNLRTAAFSAKPLAVNSRGQVDLGTGAVVAEYAARVAPAGLASLLNFLGLPPALLEDAAASGTLMWNGSRLDSKATAQGKLRLASGEINPFESTHDLSAAYDAAAKSLAVAIRRLDGNVKTGAGEAVVTLAAQQSNLLLSREGSKGLLDIRLNGAAGPTRMLALGLVGVLPQLRDLSDALYKAQAGGVYNAWLQVSEKDASTIGLNLGGVWQGAALQLDGVPYLAEAGKLSAAVEGEYAYRDNRIGVSKLFLRSDSGLMQADGTAQAVLSTDADHSITGLSNIGVNLRFVLADLSKLPLVFPGVIPSDLGLTGKMDGAFRAGGDSHDIRVDEGAVRFQGFRAAPGGVEIAVPSGTANFGANLALQLNQAASTGSPYDVFKLFTVQNGQASLTGAELQGRPINAMSSAFDLQNGVLTLRNAQLSVEGDGGAQALASGTVDFNSPAPAADLQVAVRNFPMAQVNFAIEQFMEIQSGAINLPASGQAARVSFRGFSEDEILQTIAMDNFNFATGPVTIHTGPTLNAELDKARAIMKQESAKSGEARVITFQSVTGTLTADGTGVIAIPAATPITLIGDNTGDFRAQGGVRADHTISLELFIAGKLENLIGFTIPNLIPNLRSGSDEDKNRFMAKLNENAAAGRYRVKVSGPLDHPDLSGIGELAGRFMVDIFAAAPGQIIGGVVNLGKDAPGAILDAAGAILNPENVTNPSNILRAPANITRGIGSAFGLGGNRGGGDEAAESADEQPQQEETQQRGGLPLPFLRNR